jgi:hypothetical protein
MRFLVAVAAAAVATTPAALAMQPGGAMAQVTMPALYKNCTALTKKYAHGVGKATARDKTSGTPVTTFKRSNSLYSIAISYNKGLDRDKDGIACET